MNNVLNKMPGKRPVDQRPVTFPNNRSASNPSTKSVTKIHVTPVHILIHTSNLRTCVRN